MKTTMEQRSHPLSPELHKSVDNRDMKSPYDLWKEGYVAQSNTVKLGVDKDIAHEYDHTNKDHLVKSKDMQPKEQYKPMTKVYHGKPGKVDPLHAELD